MNLLNRILKDLEHHSDLTLVGYKETLPFAPRDDVWSHGVLITLSPRIPEWKPKRLQEMQEALFPELLRAYEKKFQERDESVEFGTIWFKEFLPTRPPFEVDAKEFSTKVLFDGTYIVDQNAKLKRGIWIHLYPCRKLAEESLERRPITSLKKETLGIYKLETI